MTEPASVVAARQLADEARDRRAGVERAPGAASPHRRQHWLRTRRIRAALLAAGALTTGGCADGLVQACPAIGYGSVLVVDLAADWPAGGDRVVEFDCDPACPSPVVLEEPSPEVVPLPGTPATPRTTSTAPTAEPADPVVPVEAGRALLGLYDGRPDEVTVRVLEAGEVVAVLTVQPEYVRVDGTEECGGNSEARVVVPAP